MSSQQLNTRNILEYSTYDFYIIYHLRLEDTVILGILDNYREYLHWGMKWFKASVEYKGKGEGEIKVGNLEGS